MLNKGIFIRLHRILIPEKQLYAAYKLFFGTLTSQSRLKILNLLRKGPKNVSEIQHEIRSERTIVSHDLQRLKRCGFVSVEKKGKYRYYSLNEDTIEPLMVIIDKHMGRYCRKVIAGQRGA